ncbi:MAG: hypothetical protein J5940_03780 [Clostridia bacterium]|nr:hypothetical protein [Clostridia bacterium]
MAKYKVSARIQGVIWGLCIVVFATLLILDLANVFENFKFFANFGFWSWVVLVGGVIGIVSVILYGFNLFPMIMAAVAILYFLDFYGAISINFSKWIGPIILAVFGLYILFSALRGKGSFRDVKKEPEYVRASDRHKDNEDK